MLLCDTAFRADLGDAAGRANAHQKAWNNHRGASELWRHTLHMVVVLTRLSALLGLPKTALLYARRTHFHF
jgi:hypothetical protein